jgi:hypothetical protein
MSNQKGQWIILSGLILALGLVSLVILLNQVMSAGYKVSVAETDFASREITEIYEETVRTSKLVNAQGWDDASLSYFGANMSKIYAAHSIFLEINVTNQSSNIANLNLHYYDEKVNFSLCNRKVPL